VQRGGKKGVTPILTDIAPQRLICFYYAKEHSSYYTQYMPSRHTAGKQPPGRIQGKRRSAILSQMGQKIGRAIPGTHHWILLDDEPYAPFDSSKQ